MPTKTAKKSTKRTTKAVKKSVKKSGIIKPGDSVGRIPKAQRDIMKRVASATIERSTMGRHAQPVGKAAGATTKSRIEGAGTREDGIGQVLDHDRSQDLAVEGLNAGESAEVSGVKGESGAQTSLRHTQVVQTAGRINERWEDRIQKDGTHAFVCPICKPIDREEFTSANATEKELTKAYRACAAHIKGRHTMEVKKRKVEGFPEAQYTPSPILISPDRTIADVVGPDMAEMIQRMKENEAETGTSDLAQMSREAAGTAGGPTLQSLKIAMEDTVLGLLPKLSDKTLLEYANWTYFDGKKEMCRHATREILKRNEGRQESNRILVDF
jgi:hypothetical protein